MNIFEKFDPKTWHKETVYPFVGIINPETFEIEYSGYDLAEYFQEFDIKYFLNYDVILFLSAGSFTNLGKVGKYKNFNRVVKWEIEENE